MKAIEARIDAIRNAPLAVLGAKSAVINQEIERVESLSIDETFQEYLADAEAVRTVALASMELAFKSTKNAEDAAEKL